MENFFLFFFLKLDHFLRNFCKKCIFTIENPKKNLENISKNVKTTFRQAYFCLDMVLSFFEIFSKFFFGFSMVKIHFLQKVLKKWSSFKKKKNFFLKEKDKKKKKKKKKKS